MKWTTVNIVILILVITVCYILILIITNSMIMGKTLSKEALKIVGDSYLIMLGVITMFVGFKLNDKKDD